MRPRTQATCLALALATLEACRTQGSGAGQAAGSGSQASGSTRAGESPAGVSGGLTTGVNKAGWNETQIQWQPFAAGLRLAKSENKPICLVFYTTWCPHCRAYSHVFEDERVVQRAHDFVMIRVDADENPELSGKYMPDGKYIPRTYFLASDGTLDASLHAPATRYRFFYDEDDPTSLVLGMQAAGRRLAAR